MAMTFDGQRSSCKSIVCQRGVWRRLGGELRKSLFRHVYVTNTFLVTDIIACMSAYVCVIISVDDIL